MGRVARLALFGALALLGVLVVFLIIHEEVSDDVELLIEGSFHDTASLFHEFTEDLG